MMAAERRADQDRVEPCRCALCVALIQAAAAAEQKRDERRKMLTVVTSERRTPAA